MNRNEIRLRRKRRAQVTGTAQRPRLSIYRSLKKIEAQIIDDQAGKTLVALRSDKLGAKEFTVETARAMGKKLAEMAKQAKIETVVFDRSGYRYHGKVRALAEGAREGGLDF